MTEPPSMPSALRFTVAGDGQTRLDRLVADALGNGRRAVRAAIRHGRVRVDGHCMPAAFCPAPGSIVEIERERPHLEAEAGRNDRQPRRDEPCWIRREPPVLVIDKPAGLHTHRGKHEGSVADWICRQMPEMDHVGATRRECGIVHRLDRDTSGVLLAAVDAETYSRLREAFAAGCARKQYLALVAGVVERPFAIDVPLARRRTYVVRARRNDRSMRARTAVEVLDRGADWSLVRAEIHTGVTHQVRAHLAMAGHPLLGDAKYGGPPAPGTDRDGQLLHACSISIAETIEASAELPADFEAAYQSLRARRPRQQA